MLGRDAPRQSSATISRLRREKNSTRADPKARLAGRTYIWVDGVRFRARLEDASQCILLVIGATADSKKELLAMYYGYSESEQS
jgi:putative transposase